MINYKVIPVVLEPENDLIYDTKKFFVFFICLSFSLKTIIFSQIPNSNTVSSTLKSSNKITLR